MNRTLFVALFYLVALTGCTASTTMQNPHMTYRQGGLLGGASPGEAASAAALLRNTETSAAVAAQQAEERRIRAESLVQHRKVLTDALARELAKPSPEAATVRQLNEVLLRLQYAEQYGGYGWGMSYEGYGPLFDTSQYPYGYGPMYLPRGHTDWGR